MCGGSGACDVRKSRGSELERERGELEGALWSHEFPAGAFASHQT